MTDEVRFTWIEDAIGMGSQITKIRTEIGDKL